jgi:membrane protein implicated in regulation of membrane protease activity
MLAANVWHWWIGIALFLVGLLVVVALVAGYLKSVSAPQHPSRRQQRQQHLDL